MSLSAWDFSMRKEPDRVMGKITPLGQEGRINELKLPAADEKL
jgi:hypothetical protein